MKKVKPGAKKSASAKTVDDYLAALPAAYLREFTTEYLGACRAKKL